MKLIKSKKASENYLSKIVRVDSFRKHSDPEVQKLKCCTIDGFNIITGIDSEPGLYVYFPALSQINSDFLSYANLYKHKELNKDSEQSGMFEDNGRVKAIKLRGEISEGFILPITVFENYIISVTNQELKNVQDGSDYLLKSTGGTVKGKTIFEGGIEGNVKGNVTGNCSGSSSSCTGNAATATTANSAKSCTRK